MTGNVNRTFAINWVPPSRIRAAEKLNFQAIARGGLGGIFANQFLGRFPCGPARRSPPDIYALDLAVDDISIYFWCTKMLLIASQAARPGQAASGGWGHNTGSGVLFAGGHHRDTLVFTKLGQIIRKVRML